jgi:competence protein ComEA
MRHLPAWANNKLWLGIVLCIALGAITLGWSWLGPSAPAAGAEPALEEPIDAPLEADLPRAAEAAAGPSTVIVYISGAVRAPDVYELPSEARVKDLVLAAGGLTVDADTERINLAERLKDSEHIHLPRQGEPAADDGSAEDSAGTAQGGPLDLNTASASDLEGLPGIGAALAERIIEFRASNGALKSVEDLRNVKGIGPALFTKIAPLVTVGP